MGRSTRLPSTLGAGLVVVYRVPGRPRRWGTRLPAALRAIVLYDGGSTLDRRTSKLQLPLEGFYEASRVSPGGRMTLMVADGQSNKSERVQIRSTSSSADDRLVAINPFNGNSGFDVATFPNLPLEPGAMKATVTIDPGKKGCFDCLSLGAAVLSVVVGAGRRDGLLDVWESRSEWASKPSRLASVYPSWPLTDPTGAPLPDLGGMGASPDVQDIFVQVDYLTGSDGHSHLPARSALQSVATALQNAGPRPSLVMAGACLSTAAPGECPNPRALRRGRERPASGVVQSGDVRRAGDLDPRLRHRSRRAVEGRKPNRRDAVLGERLHPLGRELRLPRVRRGGGVEERVPGLSRCAGRPLPRRVCLQRGAGGLRAADAADAKGHLPLRAVRARARLRVAQQPGRAARRNSGIADASGGDLMVTLGLWDQQTGTPFVQGSTLLHELGHNLGLRHGGVVPSGAIEPNCKANYQSVMNYIFQVRGLLTPPGVPTVDLSRQQLPALGEAALVESAGLGGATPYLTSWYAPRASSFIASALHVSPATRRCDGSPVAATDPAYVQINGDPRTGAGLDWNADGRVTGTDAQDANFDGVTGQSFAGSNDFATMDLRQVGARRAVGSEAMSYSVIDPTTGTAPVPPAPAVGGGLSLDTGFGDLGFGDLGFGDLGFGDLGFGDLGFGDLGFGDLGFGDLGSGIWASPPTRRSAPAT